MNRVVAFFIWIYFVVLTLLAVGLGFGASSGSYSSGVGCLLLVVTGISGAAWLGMLKDKLPSLVYGLPHVPVLTVLGGFLGSLSYRDEEGAMMGLFAGLSMAIFCPITKLYRDLNPNGNLTDPNGCGPPWKIMRGGIVTAMLLTVTGAMLIGACVGGQMLWKHLPIRGHSDPKPSFAEFTRAVRRNEIQQRLDEQDQLMELNHWDPGLLHLLLPRRQQLINELKRLEDTSSVGLRGRGTAAPD